MLSVDVKIKSSDGLTLFGFGVGPEVPENLMRNKRGIWIHFCIFVYLYIWTPAPAYYFWNTTFKSCPFCQNVLILEHILTTRELFDPPK